MSEKAGQATKGEEAAQKSADDSAEPRAAVEIPKRADGSTDWVAIGVLIVRGFFEAVGRAFYSALKAKTFTRDPNRQYVVRALRTQLYLPYKDTVREVKAMRAAAEVIRQEAEAAGEVHVDVQDEVLSRWERNATRSWCITTGFLPICAVVLVNGALTPGFLGINKMFCGVVASTYCIALSLRSARDIHVFRTREAMTMRDFLKRIEVLWCPLKKRGALWALYAYGIPAVVLAIGGVGFGLVAWKAWAQ